MALLPKAVYRFNVIPIKLPMTFFTELEQIILKFIWNCKGTQNCQNNPEEKEQSWRHNSPRHQTILQSYSNQNRVVLAQKQTYGSVEQNREPRNKPTYLQSIFNKGGKNIQWRKDSLFRKWCWENWTAACKSVKLEHSLISYTKINSEWLKDLNIRHGTVKLLEEDVGKHSLT